MNLKQRNNNKIVQGSFSCITCCRHRYFCKEQSMASLCVTFARVILCFVRISMQLLHNGIFLVRCKTGPLCVYAQVVLFIEFHIYDRIFHHAFRIPFWGHTQSRALITTFCDGDRRQKYVMDSKWAGRPDNFSIIIARGCFYYIWLCCLQRAKRKQELK